MFLHHNFSSLQWNFFDSGISLKQVNFRTITFLLAQYRWLWKRLHIVNHNFSLWREKGHLCRFGGKKMRTLLPGKFMVQIAPVLPLKRLDALKRYSSNSKINGSNNNSWILELPRFCSSSSFGSIIMEPFPVSVFHSFLSLSKH
jgi:hypothetical protein